MKVVAAFFLAGIGILVRSVVRVRTKQREAEDLERIFRELEEEGLGYRVSVPPSKPN